jgi:putative membrane protein
MGTSGQVRVEPVRSFDADAPAVLDVPSGSSAQTELSKRRTALSQKRTGLSILRSHLSNERTHLSYLRTAISLVGFGITLNRFAIYLIENDRLTPTQAARPALRDASWVGIGMVVLGIVLLAWSLYRFQRTSRDIESDRHHTDWRAVLVMTVGVLVIGIATTVWLFMR